MRSLVIETTHPPKIAESRAIRQSDPDSVVRFPCALPASVVRIALAERERVPFRAHTLLAFALVVSQCCQFAYLLLPPLTVIAHALAIRRVGIINLDNLRRITGGAFA
jgi:hypothetical protein